MRVLAMVLLAALMTACGGGDVENSNPPPANGDPNPVGEEPPPKEYPGKWVEITGDLPGTTQYTDMRLVDIGGHCYVHAVSVGGKVRLWLVQDAVASPVSFESDTTDAEVVELSTWLGKPYAHVVRRLGGVVEHELWHVHGKEVQQVPETWTQALGWRFIPAWGVGTGSEEFYVLLNETVEGRSETAVGTLEGAEVREVARFPYWKSPQMDPFLSDGQVYRFVYSPDLDFVGSIERWTGESWEQYAGGGEQWFRPPKMGWLRVKDSFYVLSQEDKHPGLYQGVPGEWKRISLPGTDGRMAAPMPLHDPAFIMFVSAEEPEFGKDCVIYSVQNGGFVPLTEDGFQSGGLPAETEFDWTGRDDCWFLATLDESYVFLREKNTVVKDSDPSVHGLVVEVPGAGLAWNDGGKFREVKLPEGLDGYWRDYSCSGGVWYAVFTTGDLKERKHRYFELVPDDSK